ncbi:acetolactate decarboxylase [Pontibacter silvestris]|uniref:Alpha-acetolactate decarboxylase n=1 Tax=Pontibacter silvestris TaxID=2305183 RepID=A0ABW4WWE8_9BACT|nr:acetolactate decarboxylase [Pontibacter silvestris]MCC9136455.1 acetolactate decarboxylase [Pontibacter silvestris]
MMMRYIYLLAVAVSVLTACESSDNNTASTADTSTGDSKDTSDAIFYASLNQAIHLGQYDGAVQVRELKENGDFGVGSGEKLKSELVMLDGVAYSIPASGEASVLPDTAKVSFAAVKHFKSDQEVSISKMLNLNELESYLDSVLTKNSFAAIKVTGKLNSITYRSFYPQQKPYEPTEEVPEKELNRSNIEGTLVGFFTPESAEVLNSPVYHFHFVDNNKTTGGHVLDCTISEARVEIDYAKQLQVALPDPELVQHIDLNKPVRE